MSNEHLTSETVATVWNDVRTSLPAYAARVLLSRRGTNSAWRDVIIGWRSSTDDTGEHWRTDNGHGMNDNVEIYAWMPLPENCK